MKYVHITRNAQRGLGVARRAVERHEHVQRDLPLILLQGRPVYPRQGGDLQAVGGELVASQCNVKYPVPWTVKVYRMGTTSNTLDTTLSIVTTPLETV